MRAGNLDFMISRFPIRKFPRNFLMRTWVSDPKPIRKFLRNFLLRSRKKFKLFFGWPASQPAGPGPWTRAGPGPNGPGPWARAGAMDQGRTRAQAGAHGPGPDPGPMGQGHGPGPGPMDRAIISEAAKAADFKGGCGGAEPPRMKKVQTFFRLSKHSRVLPHHTGDGSVHCL